MVNQFPSLPHEVWINILNRIRDVKQLATCRLVCKQWDPVAEKAMFSKEELRITPNESFVSKLHYHLTKKPALALFIKDIWLVSDRDKPSLLYNELLKLLITSNLEQIYGSFPNTATEYLLYQIILKSPHKFNKIKRLPTTLESGLRTQCLYALRKSLQRLDLSASFQTPNLVQDHLNEFIRLERLSLQTRDIRDISELDSILSRLQCATQLHLEIDFMEEGFISKSSDQMETWLTQYVKIDERINSIDNLTSTTQDHWCNLADYIAYKYPNLQKLQIASMVIDDGIERILQATKRIPYFVLSGSAFDSAEHLWTVGYLMKSPRNTIQIQYVPALVSDDGYCYLDDIRRDNRSATSSFAIVLEHDTPHTYIKQLLSSVGSGTSVITKALVDLVHWRDQHITQDLMSFYDILRLTPNVQQLEFRDATIEYQELGHGELMLNNLKILDIVGAKIDHRVIPQISSIAPNLKEFRISSSLVVGRKEKLGVVMPRSNLSILKIQTYEFDSWGLDDCWNRPELRELKSNEEKLVIDEIIYLRIKTEIFPIRHYVLKPDNDGRNTVITEEEFHLHATASRTIYIECKSLSVLEFLFDDLMLEMHFKNGVLERHFNGIFRCSSPFAESQSLKLEKRLHDLEKE